MLKLPTTLVAELTYSCNHKCLFCSCPWETAVYKKEPEMTTAEWADALKKLKNFGANHVTFTGGEATLRSDLFEILSAAKNLGYTLGLITNGKAVNRDFLEKLQPFDLLLSISVPGIESFESTTKTDGIEHTLELFKFCKELNISTVANIAVTKKNINELYENIALPLIYGANYVLLNRFLPGGRGLKNKEFLLSVDEINEMLDTAETVLEKSATYGHVGTELPYCIIKNPEKYKYLSIGSLCSAGKQFFVVDPSGFIKVCNHSPEKLCRWTEIETLETNDYWNKFINSDYIPSMCKNCEHLNIRCDGGCREAAHVFGEKTDDADPCFANNL